VTIGITDYAQLNLGDIENVSYKAKAGCEVEEDLLLLDIESDKTVFEIASPVKGKLLGVNKILEEK
jgi:glycine cleavage system H lipoate-binding protein